MSEPKPQITNESFTVVPSPNGVGAEISGVDLTQAMSDAVFSGIRAAFFEYGVIYFRGQTLTVEDQTSFSQRFGELDKSSVLSQYLHPGHPEIFLVSNIVDKDGRHLGAYDAGRMWHFHLSYEAKPSMCSMLYALEIPHDDAGKALGDTQFASMSRAYASLPGDVKQRLDGRKAVNTLAKRFARKEDVNILSPEKSKLAEATHPAIRTHPANGRKCIFVNEAHTDRILDLAREESDALLATAWEACKNPAFRYRHSWRVGDAVMWDNCAVQHLATFDYKLPQRRLLHRTTVVGTTPY